MAPSFDWAVPSLLCAEDNDSIFYDDVGYDVCEGFQDDRWHPGNHRIDNQNQSFNGEVPFNDLPLQSEEFLALLMKREFDQLPANGYLGRLRNGDLDLVARQEAIDWIAKVHAHFGFGPLCLYLSINYLDRFLSSYELPEGSNWMMQLLAVACLSLAAKLEETEVPLSLDLQVGESRFLFEAKTIQRMELLVLSTLKWRMQAITPFSFIDYFIKQMKGADQIASRAFIFRSTQLILSTLNGIDFLEFRPSEIAEAVAMSVVGEEQAMDAEKAVDKERVMKCVGLINGLSLLNGSVKVLSNASVQSVPQSPIGVLDAACLSYLSDGTTVGSCSNSSHSTLGTKRRRLNDPCEEVEG